MARRKTCFPSQQYKISKNGAHWENKTNSLMTVEYRRPREPAQ